MKSGGSRANALLIELLLVIIFFMFTAVTLVQVFALSRSRSKTAEEISQGVLEAQNYAELLYGAEDADVRMKELGFTEEDGVWSLDCDGYLVRVTEETDKTEAGTLRTLHVSTEKDGRVLVTVPSARYFPEEVSP
jgi:hypothetical protein